MHPSVLHHLTYAHPFTFLCFFYSSFTQETEIDLFLLQQKGGVQITNMLLHPPLSSSITAMPSSSSSSSSSSHHHHKHHSKKLSSSNPNPNHPNSSTLVCKHSPSATLDILILILVLFSCTFLITSYFSYIFQSLSRILPSLFVSHSDAFKQSPFPYVLGFLIFFAVSVVSVEICCSYRSRKCDKPGCKGLKKAMEFDIQLQTEDCLKKKSGSSKEIDKLPWKGGSEGNPDYECLRSELRRMAPPNGRAVLLFRTRCGCPVAKLEAWGPKRSRRHKKALSNMVLDGGGGGGGVGDHR